MENRTSRLAALDEAESVASAAVDLAVLAIALEKRQVAIQALSLEEPSAELIERLSRSIAWGDAVRERLTAWRKAAVAEWQEGERRRLLLRNLSGGDRTEPAWVDQEG